MNKKLLFSIAAAVICTLSASFTACASLWGDDPAPWEKNLPFKSAVIEYRINGMQNGTRTTYIKDYGRYEAKYTTTAMHIMGISRAMKTVEITTPEWVYDIDLMQKTGTKTVNPAKYMMEEYEKLSSSDRKKFVENAKKTGAALMQGMQGQVKKGAAEVLGRKCDVISMQGIKLYVLAGTGLPLKSESNMMGMKSVEEAVKITEGSVPEDRFEPPAGIHIEEDRQSDQMARQMARNIIQALVEDRPVSITPPAPAGTGPHGFPPAHTSTPRHTPSGNEDGVPPDMNEFMKRIQGLTGRQPHDK